MGGIVETLRDPESEKIFGVEIGVVEGIDIHAETGAENAGERRPVSDCRDALQQRLQGCETPGLDGGQRNCKSYRAGPLRSNGKRPTARRGRKPACAPGKFVELNCSKIFAAVATVWSVLARRFPSFPSGALWV